MGPESGKEVEKEATNQRVSVKRMLRSNRPEEFIELFRGMSPRQEKATAQICFFVSWRPVWVGVFLGHMRNAHPILAILRVGIQILRYTPMLFAFASGLLIPVPTSGRHVATFLDRQVAIVFFQSLFRSSFGVLSA